MDVNENFRGFGGECWPKDVRILSKILEKSNTKFFDYLMFENNKWRTSVFGQTLCGELKEGDVVSFKNGYECLFTGYKYSEEFCFRKSK